MERNYAVGEEGPDPFAASKARIGAVARGEVSIPKVDERLRTSAPGRYKKQAEKAHAAWQKTEYGSPYGSMFP
jgi:hypothetical protein